MDGISVDSRMGLNSSREHHVGRSRWDEITHINREALRDRFFVHAEKKKGQKSKAEKKSTPKQQLIRAW